MRLNRYIREENIVQKGLDVDEPEISRKYSERVIENNKKTIEKAISKIGKPSDDAEESMLSDLEDKLEKWNNVEKETEPVGPFKEPENKEEPTEPPPEEEPEKEEDPPEEDEEKEK